MRTMFLPPYLPELNLQERVWGELREDFNLAFDNLDALEMHMEEALKRLESSQNRMRSVTGLEWVIISFFNEN